jgi:hypothetical protein
MLVWCESVVEVLKRVSHKLVNFDLTVGVPVCYPLMLVPGKIARRSEAIHRCCRFLPRRYGFSAACVMPTVTNFEPLVKPAMPP